MPDTASGARWSPPQPVLFPASKEADYLNGTILNVEGGWRVR